MKRKVSPAAAPPPIAGAAISALLIAGIGLASCSSPNGPSGPTGTVTGTLQVVGASPGASPQAVAGDITLHKTNGDKTGIDVGANGRFSIAVPVGTYTVTAQSQAGTTNCQAPGPITVTTGVTTRLEVDCHNN
jgi:hypothetical protein